MEITTLIINVENNTTETIKREMTEQELYEMEVQRKKFDDNQKLFELTNWFDNYFDKQLIQSQWQDDFTVSHDDYFNKDYANIDELKAQAKIVREEIKQLRQN